MIDPIDLPARKAGLRVIADVHGHAEALRAALDAADEAGMQPVLLGDLVDRGPDSPGVVREVLKRGLTFLPGNHDNKFARWYAGNPVKVGADLDATIAQFAAAPDGAQLMADYVAAVRAAPMWRRAGRTVLVHAGFDLRMLSLRGPSLDRPGKVPRQLRALAIYGETSGETDAEGRMVRSYRWLDQIPEGITVVIGHDVLSTEAPVIRTNAKGGRLINLDTGIDRGGPLSHLDIPAAELTAEIDLRTADPAPKEPLLTLLVGPSGAGKSTWVAENADPKSVISSDGIRAEIYGDFREQGDRNEVMRVLVARARDRLARGLPVVLDATHLARRDRLNSAALVPPHHPVRYVLIDRPLEEKLRDAGWRADVVLDPETGASLVEVHDERAKSSLQHAREGDGLPNVTVEDRRRSWPLQKTRATG